jgi:hypothetical protein
MIKKAFFVWTLLVLSLAGYSFETFKIVSPQSGSTVREKIVVKIPKKSMWPNSYVAFWLDDQFLGALKPVVTKAYHIYEFDSKALNLPDNYARLTAVLYAEDKDKRSQKKTTKAVTDAFIWINIDNKASLRFPAEGQHLQYRFHASKEQRYRYKEYVRSEGANAQPTQLVAHYNIAYIIQNIQNENAVMKIEASPLKGSKTIQVRSDKDIRKSDFIEPTRLTPIFMELTPSGREKVGFIPKRIDLSQDWKTSLHPERLDARYTPVFWPVFSEYLVQVGESFKGLLLADKRLLGQTGSKHLTREIPVNAVVEGLEWEMGHPCAKIRYQADFSEQNDPYTTTVSNKPFAFTSLEQIAWFDYKKGILVRLDLVQKGNFIPEKLVEKRQLEQNENDDEYKELKRTKSPRPGGAFSANISNESTKPESEGAVQQVIMHSSLVLHSH